MIKFRNIFSELPYTKFASFYDLICEIMSVGKWHKWQRYTLDKIKGDIIIEIGCGSGRLLVAAQENNYIYVGIDKSIYMLKKSHKRLSNIFNNNHLVKANSTAIPIKSSIIDSIVITFPTDYILDKSFYEEANRLLKSSGRLIILDLPYFYRAPLSLIFNYFLELPTKRDLASILSVIGNKNYKVVTEEIKDESSVVSLIIAEKV